jgi:S1-C subfamily serine protease
LDDKRYLIVGDLLRAVVESNGFKINEKKFRVQDKSHRQAVTGLVVNRKVNLKKGYVKNIRAALHAWETYGPQKAAKKFFEKFDSKQRLRPATSFPKILRGKIEFLKSIKSDRDKSYIRFVNKYNELVYNGKPQLPLDAFEEIIQSVWVVRCGSKTGTAFMLKDYGLVTCEHCINATDPIEVFRYNEYSGPSRKKAQIVKSNKEIDLAVLSFNGIADFPSLKSSSIDSRRGDSVTTIGFPYYISGNPPLPFNGEVRNVALFGSMTRIILTQTLQAGESGGPALNDNNEVVGVIVGGADHPSVTPYVTNYAIIPIKDILSLR